MKRSYKNMTKALTTLERIELVLEYIMEHEREDFDDNPSTNHIYYHAMVVSCGEIYAQNEFQMTLEESLKVRDYEKKL